MAAVKAPPNRITHEEFARLCADAQYRDRRLELTAEGELIDMPPAGSESGRRNMGLSAQLYNWSLRGGSGIAFDSSAGFTLPNGAIRSPNASWIAAARWNVLSPADRKGFAHICPDFVAELRSDSDAVADVQAKMRDYMANGARLGWLIDPQRRSVEIYRPGHAVEALDAPAAVSADPELPGFTLDLADIW